MVYASVRKPGDLHFSARFLWCKRHQSSVKGDSKADTCTMIMFSTPHLSHVLYVLPQPTRCNDQLPEIFNISAGLVVVHYVWYSEGDFVS